MFMKKLLYAVLGIVLMSGVLVSCKTSEKNYRQAYERTMARDSARTSFDETIYGRYRRQARTENVKVGDDTVSMQRITVYVNREGGAVRENLKRYCVVAASFKQLFNARSVRQRLVDNGYPGAFIVQTKEPYYYVVALSTTDLAQAREALGKLTTQPPFPLKEPFILRPTGL